MVRVSAMLAWHGSIRLDQVSQNLEHTPVETAGGEPLERHKNATG